MVLGICAMTAPNEIEGERQLALQDTLDRLELEPWAFDFFALLRRLECLRPQAPRVGCAQRPSQELLRLGQVAELDFAPAPIVRFVRVPPGAGRLGVRFFGLLGPHGPMPLHITEFVRERRHQHADPTLERFLDIFHHRMLSLFYRAWAQSQPTVQMDRPADDRYAAWLGATFGLGAGTTRRDAVPDAAKRFQAGLIASRSRHPEALRKVLRHYFEVPIEVRSHVAHWMAMHDDDVSRLGYATSRPQRRALGGGGAQLGRSANAGRKVFDRQFKFRLEVGPLSLARYEAFLPGGSAWQELHDWVALLAGGELIWDAQLGLRRAEVPPPRLGRFVRLGLTSWLIRKPGRTTPKPADTRPDLWDLRLRPLSSPLLSRPGAAHG